MPTLVHLVARAVVVLSMGVTCFVASAEIYRCKDDKGQTVLSDRPCGAVFSGEPLRTNGSGSGLDRISAVEMRGRAQDVTAQYAVMAERAERSARKLAGK